MQVKLMQLGIGLANRQYLCAITNLVPIHHVAENNTPTPQLQMQWKQAVQLHRAECLYGCCEQSFSSVRCQHCLRKIGKYAFAASTDCRCYASICIRKNIDVRYVKCHTVHLLLEGMEPFVTYIVQRKFYRNQVNNLRVAHMVSLLHLRPGKTSVTELEPQEVILSATYIKCLKLYNDIPELSL